MTWNEARERLAAAGIEFEKRPFGLQADVGAPSGQLRLQIGRSSAGGDELSVRTPEGQVRWFMKPTLSELVDLVLQAQEHVKRGESPSLLDALLVLDPR